MPNTKNSDGYRWRKYGRKKVKNSTHPRNYYKCNVADCPAKKYMEKIVGEDGTIKYNTIYKGQHCHDPPSVTEIPRIETQESFKNIVQTKMAIASEEDFISSDTQAKAVKSKKKKKSGPRLMVELNNNVNAREDGYHWRKYGEKPLKASSVSRSYFKCSDCTVKKQVEISEEKTLVIYEGIHTHSASETSASEISSNEIVETPPIKKRKLREISLTDYCELKNEAILPIPVSTSLIELCDVATFVKPNHQPPPIILEPKFMPSSTIYPYYHAPPIISDIEEDYLTDKTVQTLLFLKSVPLDKDI